MVTLHVFVPVTLLPSSELAKLLAVTVIVAVPSFLAVMLILAEPFSIHNLEVDTLATLGSEDVTFTLPVTPLPTVILPCFSYCNGFRRWQC